jgi:hypothetical protein
LFVWGLSPPTPPLSSLCGGSGISHNELLILIINKGWIAHCFTFAVTVSQKSLYLFLSTIKNSEVWGIAHRNNKQNT